MVRGARRAIGADQRFLEVGAVAGKPAGQRNFVADDVADPGHQLAAVDVQAVGQNEHAGEIVGLQRTPDRLAVVPRPLRIADILPAQLSTAWRRS